VRPDPRDPGGADANAFWRGVRQTLG